jgi:hypothetical protein
MREAFQAAAETPVSGEIPSTRKSRWKGHLSTVTSLDGANILVASLELNNLLLD